MAAQSHNAEAISRGARMLRTALGPQIAEWLDDESVVEVMLNPDGPAWLDCQQSGLEDPGARPSLVGSSCVLPLAVLLSTPRWTAL